MRSLVHITFLANGGDERGRSFSAGKDWSAFLPGAKDMHVTSLKPGYLRGNHFHRRKREVIMVLHNDDWTLHWDNGPGTDVQTRTFPGSGAVLITVEPFASHTVVNTGHQPLHTIGLTNEAFDPNDPDTNVREISAPIGRKG